MEPQPALTAAVLLCRPTVAATVAAVAGVPRSGGAAELVVRPAVLSSCTTPAAPVSTTGSNSARRDSAVQTTEDRGQTLEERESMEQMEEQLCQTLITVAGSVAESDANQRE
jgi:hypothetical protein